MKKIILIFLFFLMVLPVWPMVASAATYYVDKNDPSASDSNDGSEGSPWESAQYGALQLTAGDTLIIKAGEYYYNTADDDVPGILPAASGTEANPITIKANPGDDVYLMSGPTLSSGISNFTNPAIGTGNNDTSAGYDWIIIDGFKVYGSVALWKGDNSVLQNCELWEGGGQDSSFGSVIRVEDTTGVTITNNYLHDNKDGGGGTANSPLIMEYDSTNLIIEKNTFKDVLTGHAGVRLKDNPETVYVRYNLFIDGGGVRTNNQDQGNDIFIHNNIFVNSQVRLNAYVDNVNVYNNTFYADGDTPRNCITWNNTSVTDIEIYNNIFYRSADDYFYEFELSDLSEITTSNWNTFYGSYDWRVNYSTVATSLSQWQSYGSYGFDANSITTDPGFVQNGASMGDEAEDFKRSSYTANGRGGSYESVMGAWISNTNPVQIGYSSIPAQLPGGVKGLTLQ